MEFSALTWDRYFDTCEDIILEQQDGKNSYRVYSAGSGFLLFIYFFYHAIGMFIDFNYPLLLFLSKSKKKKKKKKNQNVLFDLNS